MKDSFEILMKDYIENLKKMNNKNFFMKKLYSEKELSYFKYEKLIKQFIIDVFHIKKTFKNKSIDSQKTFKNLFDEFYQIDIDINDMININKEKFPFSWIIERHKRFKKLAQKCITNTVYEDNKILNNIKFK